MYCDISTEAKRQTRREMRRKFWPVYIVYAVALATFEFVHPARNSPLAYVLAILLALSMIGMLVALSVITTRQKDEFQKKLLLQSMVWATSGMLAITTTWGLLEVYTNVRHLPLLMNFPIFVVIMAIAKVTLFRQNRPVDE